MKATEVYEMLDAQWPGVSEQMLSAGWTVNGIERADVTDMLFGCELYLKKRWGKDLGEGACVLYELSMELKYGTVYTNIGSYTGWRIHSVAVLRGIHSVAVLRGVGASTIPLDSEYNVHVFPDDLPATIGALSLDTPEGLFDQYHPDHLRALAMAELSREAPGLLDWLKSDDV